MNAFKNKLNLGEPGVDRMDIIHAKSMEIHQKFEDSKDNVFTSKYTLDVELGQGMHAQVFKCFKIDDIDR